MTKRVAAFTMLLLLAWCVMTLTHEAGHLVGGWCCGGRLVDADLWPWHLPYSIFDPDPYPLVTLWSGLILGVLVPVLLAVIVRNNWLWFVAYFCVLANGTYIAAGWFSADPELDTTKLLRHGASPFFLLIYCAITIGFGYVGFRRHCISFFARPPSSQE